MLRPENFRRSTPLDAVKCSMVATILLDPDSVLWIAHQAINDMLTVVRRQIVTAGELLRVLEEGSALVYSLPAETNVGDPELAVASVTGAMEETEQALPAPWGTFESDDAFIQNWREMFQGDRPLRTATANNLTPLEKYCNEEGTSTLFNLYKALLKLDWSADRYTGAKYSGVVTPIGLTQKGRILIPGGPYAVDPGTRYDLDVNGVVSQWSVPEAEPPTLYGSSEPVVVTEASPASLAVAVSSDPIDTTKQTYLGVMSLGGGLVEKPLGCIASQGDMLYFPTLLPGDRWHEVADVGDLIINVPTLTAGPGALACTLCFGRLFSVVIDGVSQSTTLPTPSSTFLTTANLIAALGTLTGVVVVEYPTEVLIVTDTTGASRSLGWDGSGTWYPPAYDIYGVNPLDPGSTGADDGTTTTFRSAEGTAVLTLLPGTYSVADVAAEIDAAATWLHAAVVGGNLTITADGYGDVSYLEVPDGEVFGLQELAWGTSVYMDDTVDLDFAPMKAVEHGPYQITPTDGTDFVLPAILQGQVNTSWVLLVREIGAKRFRAYHLLGSSATVVQTLVDVRRTGYALPQYEVKFRYSPSYIYPMSNDLPSTISMQPTVPAMNPLRVSAGGGIGQSNKVAPITTTVGYSPIRVGDLVLLTEGAPETNDTVVTKVESNYIEFSIPVPSTTATAIFWSKGVTMLRGLKTAISDGLITCEDVPTRDMSGGSLKPALNVYIAWLNTIISQSVLSANQIESVDAILDYAREKGLDRVSQALSKCWFDQLFQLRDGDSAIAAVSGAPVIGDQMIGFEGGGPETQHDSLNPGSDAVEYVEEDGRVY